MNGAKCVFARWQSSDHTSTAEHAALKRLEGIFKPFSVDSF
jgi:hypothetical protein